MIDDNELTGPIPTEIGLLAALESMNLGKWLFSLFTVLLLDKTNSLYASNFLSLILHLQNCNRW